ncbi:MAG: Fe(3+) ABC transporter substrate-binding protein [Flavobacteriaceae bacterium]|nr:Fe(3+) ABC transporter substrate-binding protein [Flavobacteriaceae bacterium]|tara:strand:- start:3393 stop:4415 length:1023 start_codon:yes stop_codon:yes gene_type:complete
MKNLPLYILIICSLCGCNNKQSDIVNLYSQRHYKVDEIQYEKFTALTGIKVNVVKSNADELIERLKNEGADSQADIFISVDAGKLQKAASLDLLQKLSDDIKTNEIPSTLLDKNNLWVPLTYRARILVYSNDRVNVTELDSYESLSDEKWKNRILVRSSSNAYNQALMASVIANNGIDGAKKWSQGVVENLARSPKGNDRDQVKAIYAGLGDVAIVNSYYIGLLLSSEKDEEQKAGEAVSVFFPNQGENQTGTHINISGLGIAKNAPNLENAIKLINYLLSEEAQKTYVRNSYEYSVNKNVMPSEIVQKWGDFRIDSLDLNNLGIFRKDAIEVFETTNWK